MDALELEEDDESTSYLADLNKAPDYIDEEPVEAKEVRGTTLSEFGAHILIGFTSYTLSRRLLRTLLRRL